MDAVTRCFFDLLRSEIDESFEPAVEKDFFTDDVIRQLYSLSKKHDLTHLVSDALYRHGFLSEEHPLYGAFQKQQMTAVLRTSQQEYELEEICRALENARIRFVPLKGSVLRKLYPQSWMRTSCDIDILVEKQNMKSASQCLVDQLNYRFTGGSAHDQSFYSQTGIHVELHYALVEHGRSANADAVLQNVWEYVISNGSQYRLEMTDGMFYFYHLAHMAKHLEVGGCGIRPFMDLFVLNQHVPDQSAREELLGKGGLSKFCAAAVALSQVWFNGAEHDALTEQLEAFIISGGMYGNAENRVTLQQKKKKGKFGYFLSRMFLPYADLKSRYPVLEKHKWLFPFMQVRRWLWALFGSAHERMIREIKANHSVTASEAEAASRFLSELGL